MPPKIKVTRGHILAAAVELVRRSGAQALNARAIAAMLNCSTQPVFSNFATMEELRLAVVAQAEARCEAYIQRETESGQYPPYKASGMAYIRFAKEEQELFRLLYMRDRSDEEESDEAVASDLGRRMEHLVQGNTGLSDGQAQLFHLEMWAYVHGIAAMYATGFLDLPTELISRMLTDAYQGLCKQFGTEG